jgi:hypothetical protein
MISSKFAGGFFAITPPIELLGKLRVLTAPDKEIEEKGCFILSKADVDLN